MTTTPTTEAEAVAALSCSKDIVFFTKLAAELRLAELTKPPPILYQDNAAAISFFKSKSDTRRTRHLDIGHHYVRDLLSAGLVDIRSCPTEFMTADILTKPLGPRLHSASMLGELCAAPAVAVPAGAAVFAVPAVPAVPAAVRRRRRRRRRRLKTSNPAVRRCLKTSDPAAQSGGVGVRR